MVLAHKKYVHIYKTPMPPACCCSPISELFRVSFRTDSGDDISAFLDIGQLTWLAYII